ncbi:MAG: DUF2167 domain-containing protein [Steroidobacter sp.]
MFALTSNAATRLAAAALFVFAPLSFAQETPPATDPHESAWKAAGEAMQPGPATITLRDQAQINLPEGYGFIPPKEGAALMSAMGNQTDPNFLGLIFPTGEAEWFVTVDFDPAGYIKDDDAKDWDADELLQNLKDGTEAANEHRKEVGVPPIEVTRWIEKPTYDASAHRLVWSAEIKDKGTSGENAGINYNTYVLGREGYVSLNLVTSAAEVEAHKPAAHQLLAAVNFNDGKRYTDFNASTDKVAAYGLAALVGGLAAKKLGLLATLGLLLAKFGKIIVVAVAALGAGAVKLFKGKKDDGTAA